MALLYWGMLWLGKGERTFVVGVLTLGFLVNLYFSTYWIPLPLQSRVFCSLEGGNEKKVKFFIRHVIYGRVNTLDRLSRKMSSLVGPFCCILCRRAEEDLDHLLWNCT